jgi:putative transposase
VGQSPTAIRTDNGHEFVSSILDQLAHGREVRLEHIRPGKPMENGHIESFYGRLLDECLDAQAFRSLAEAKGIIAALRQDYNIVRLNCSLAGMSFEEYRREA